MLIRKKFFVKKKKKQNEKTRERKKCGVFFEISMYKIDSSIFAFVIDLNESMEKYGKIWRFFGLSNLNFTRKE